jgi:S-adenosylmethionine hydrolase
MNRIITLTTDFGLSDGFVGAMKGVILGINPQAIIVDITHDIAPQNIAQGAFLLAHAVQYFPARAIHVVVVDPGVGSARRAIALQIGETIFAAPDNGVLSYALRNTQHATRAVHLNKSQYWLPRVSHTFHGRDIFAPVAAHLSLGVPLDALGEPIDDWVRLALPEPTQRADGAIVGAVVHVDRFGNVVTNISEEMLAAMDRARVIVSIAGRTLHGVKETYADAARGELIALISSSWHLEIAAREGNGAQELGVRVGDEIVVAS